jgi:hypothetical protein
MSLIIDGKPEDVPGLRTVSWLDDPRIPRLLGNRDSRRRTTRWIRGIVLHTTKGIPGGKDRRAQVVRPGFGPAGDRGLHVSRYWSTSQLQSGAHLIVDFDGEIVQVADLQLEAAHHAGPVNDVTIGIEIYQGSDAELYAEQLATVVQLCDFLTRRFGIQRQIPDVYSGPIARLEGGGRNVVGVYGHRDVTGNRGAGDPGDAVMGLLAAAGYERHNFAREWDREVWQDRQRDLGLEADGIPGPATVRAIAAAGLKHGMWISRPGD